MSHLRIPPHTPPREIRRLPRLFELSRLQRDRQHPQKRGKSLQPRRSSLLSRHRLRRPPYPAQIPLWQNLLLLLQLSRLRRDRQRACPAAREIPRPPQNGLHQEGQEGKIRQEIRKSAQSQKKTRLKTAKRL